MMKTRLLSYGFVAATLLVGLAYIFILMQVRAPSVTDEYRVFYLEQDLKGWPGKDGLDYKIGDVIDLSKSKTYLTRDWSHNESDGAWSNGEVVGLRLGVEGQVQPDQQYRLGIDLSGRYASKNWPRQRVFVNANNAQIGEFVLTDKSPKQQSLEFVVDGATLAASSILYLDFILPDAMHPIQQGDGRERRKLGIKLARLQLTVANEVN